MSESTVHEAELERAIRALSDPVRLRQAQDLVARAAPSLQRVLAGALADGGWFDAGHRQAVCEAVGEQEVAMRARAVDTLLAEETRLAMLVGVAVGFELARELRADHLRDVRGPASQREPQGADPREPQGSYRTARAPAQQADDDEEDRWR